MLDLDLTADLELFDGLRRVVYHQLRTDGRVNECWIRHALRHQVGLREAAASGGRYTTQDVIFNVPESELSWSPGPGDKIREEEPSGQRRTWTILSVELASLRSRYRLTCRDLVLVNRLTDAITIWAPINVQDAAGSRVQDVIQGGPLPGYSPVQEGVPALIQEVGGEGLNRHGRRVSRRRYKIHCGERVHVSPQDRIVDRNGTTYEFVSDEGMDMLDFLQVINAERDE
jgi:hypothetical protein